LDGTVITPDSPMEDGELLQEPGDLFGYLNGGAEPIVPPPLAPPVVAQPVLPPVLPLVAPIGNANANADPVNAGVAPLPLPIPLAAAAAVVDPFAAERARFQARIASLEADKAKAALKSKAKRAEPSKFTSLPGTASVDVWLRRVRQHCIDSGDEPDSHVATAVSYLDLGPWNYWDASKRSGRFDADAAREWATFEKVMREGYGATDLERVARRKLQTFKQGAMSAREYTVAFNQILVDIPELDKTSRMDAYVAGLNPQLLAQVFADPLHGKRHTDLLRFQDFVESRDDVYRDLQQMGRPMAAAGAQSAVAGPSNSSGAGRRARKRGGRGLRGSASKSAVPNAVLSPAFNKTVQKLLHVLGTAGSIQKPAAAPAMPSGKLAFRKERSDLPFSGQRGICWKCGKPGHSFPECSKN
jgi:hypothetical protein